MRCLKNAQDNIAVIPDSDSLFLYQFLLDNCRKLGLVFENVVGIVEIINSKAVQLQVREGQDGSTIGLIGLHSNPPMTFQKIFYIKSFKVTIKSTN